METKSSGQSANRLPRVVLNMIVKNEAHVIERCLSSILPVIDAWCIVDTGSDDGTQDVIRRFLDGLPGEVIEEEWVNFAINRSRALDHAAKWGEYALVIDADVRCVVSENFAKEPFRASLEADFYQIMIRDQVHYQRPMLTSTALPFRYRGSLHEFLVIPDGATNGGIIDWFHYKSHFDGARSKNPYKAVDDAATIIGAIHSGEEDDLETRNVFYLANTLRDGGDFEAAIEVYLSRVSMGGWPEEVYVSHLNVGRLLHILNADSGAVIDAFLRAHDACPTRAEALCSAAGVARTAGRMASSHVLASRALEIPRPHESLFQEPDVYEWRSLYEFSIAAWHVGDFGNGLRACHRLLFEDKLPPAERDAVVRNIDLYPAEAISW